VSGPRSDDGPADRTNGTSKGRQESVAPISGTPEDVRECVDHDQHRADVDQAGSDTDQTSADSDQTGSDQDQAASDSDQAASASDQAASDRDLARGGNPTVHDTARNERDRAARQRQDASVMRLEAAAERDVVARARDLISLGRDEAAEQRDREMSANDASWSDDNRTASTAELILRAAENRERAAADRAHAAEARARAAVDREQAAHDRFEARGGHDALLRQLAIAETDALTGARMRAAGLEDFDHEIDRARRLNGTLAVAYVDVVGLKTVNDAYGHAAGDALLQRAVRGIRGHLRSYDLIVRVGGDEFLCVMSDATITEARKRFATIQAALTADSDRCEIKVGFAALAPDDSADELIRRADAELPTSPRRQ
jgi:diguanylate cyclase (GGDEF)-like protein